MLSFVRLWDPRMAMIGTPDLAIMRRIWTKSYFARILANWALGEIFNITHNLLLRLHHFLYAKDLRKECMHPQGR